MHVLQHMRFTHCFCDWRLERSFFPRMNAKKEEEWWKAQESSIRVDLDLINTWKQHLLFLASIDRYRCLYHSPTLHRSIYRCLFSSTFSMVKLFTTSLIPFALMCENSHYIKFLYFSYVIFDIKCDNNYINIKPDVV